jgi:hypothetical protein
MILEGPYFAGCLLLVAAGLAKAVHPDDTARAVSQLLRHRRNLAVASHVIRLLALIETLLGAAALLLPGTTIPPALVALSYASFTAFVVLARARGGVLSSCGCFGKADTPPTVAHLAITAGIAVSAVMVAAASRPGRTTLWANLSPQPWHGVPLLLTSLALAFAAWVAMTLLPRVRMAGVAQ